MKSSQSTVTLWFDFEEVWWFRGCLTHNTPIRQGQCLSIGWSNHCHNLPATLPYLPLSFNNWKLVKFKLFCRLAKTIYAHGGSKSLSHFHSFLQGLRLTTVLTTLHISPNIRCLIRYLSLLCGCCVVVPQYRMVRLHFAAFQIVISYFNGR